MKDSEKRPETAVRESLESLRAKLFLRFGEKGTRRILVGVPIAILALVLLIVCFLLFPIREIEVTGDVTMFNEGEIIEAAELSEGDSLFARSKGRIERELRRNLPLANHVKITKSLSGKVKIEIEFDKVRYYTKIGEYYYAIDESLRVLDLDESRSKYSAYGAVLVKLPETREPVKGERLVFYDTVEETDTEGETVYEVREPKFYDYATTFLSELSDSGFLEQADGVVLEEKFDITLIYAEKYRIKFGDVGDLDAKFRVLFGILDEGSMQYADLVSVDLTTPSKATARADATLDISEFLD